MNEQIVFQNDDDLDILSLSPTPGSKFHKFNLLRRLHFRKPRFSKKAIYVFFLFLGIASIIFLVYPSFERRGFSLREQSKQGVQNPVIEMINPSVSVNSWPVSEWKNFKFKAPIAFTLKGGDLNSDFFTLSYRYTDSPLTNIQIIGISEKPTLRINEVISERKQGIGISAKGITVEKQDKVSENKYILYYVWDLSTKQKISVRNVDFIKYYGIRVVSLRISAPLNVWDEKGDMLNSILAGVEF